MTKSITVTITRTFTRTDDPFGLFGLLHEAGDLNNAATELRWETLYVEDDERRLKSVDALLDDAEWITEVNEVGK
jgi:hypothetical protein